MICREAELGSTTSNRQTDRSEPKCETGGRLRNTQHQVASKLSAIETTTVNVHVIGSRQQGGFLGVCQRNVGVDRAACATDPYVSSARIQIENHATVGCERITRSLVDMDSATCIKQSAGQITEIELDRKQVRDVVVNQPTTRFAAEGSRGDGWILISRQQARTGFALEIKKKNVRIGSLTRQRKHESCR